MKARLSSAVADRFGSIGDHMRCHPWIAGAGQPCLMMLSRVRLHVRGQSARGLAGFFGLLDLALTGFCEEAGRMPSGFPTATGTTAGSGGLKYTRQPGDSWV